MRIAPGNGSSSHSNFIKILNKSELMSISLLNEHLLYIFLAIYGQRLRKIQYWESSLVKSFVKMAPCFKVKPLIKAIL